MKTFQSYFENTAADLTKALNNHDWSYEMSDDHRYYVSGQRSYSNIKSLIEKMVEEGQDKKAKEILDTCEYPYKDKRFIEPFYNYLFAVKNKPKEIFPNTPNTYKRRAMITSQRKGKDGTIRFIVTYPPDKDNNEFITQEYSETDPKPIITIKSKTKEKAEDQHRKLVGD